MICLETMTSDQFNYYSKFSFDMFVNEYVKSTGQSAEDVRLEVGGPPERLTENDLWYAIRFENQYIGFVWIHLQPKKKEAFIWDFYIDIDFRSKGLGRETLVSCVEQMKNNSVEKVKLCVFQDNSVARNLYSSLGFKETHFNLERRQYTLALLL